MAAAFKRGSPGDDLARRAALEGETVRAVPAAAAGEPGPQLQLRLAACHQAVKIVMAAFGAAIPGKANLSGHYQAEPGDAVRFGGPAPDTIPDGKYRVIGSDWAGRFEAGRLVEAFRCVPPHFGGDDIEIVN